MYTISCHSLFMTHPYLHPPGYPNPIPQQESMQIITNTHHTGSRMFLMYTGLAHSLSLNTPQGARAWSVRGWLDSSLLVLHASCPDTPSSRPCAVEVLLADGARFPGILYHTMWANVQSTDLWRRGGQSLNCGRTVHSLGILTGSNRNMPTMRYLVHSQMSRPSPHSVMLCMILSSSPQVEQRTEPVSRMACSRNLVGRMSWIMSWIWLISNDAIPVP
jgi:hypothetical protein